MAIRDSIFAIFAIANLLTPSLVIAIHFTVVQTLVKDKHCVNISLASFWVAWVIEMAVAFGITFYVFWQFDLGETITKVKQGVIAVLMGLISVGVLITWSFMLDRPFNCINNVTRFMADETGPFAFWLFYLITFGIAFLFIRVFKTDRDIRVFSRFKQEDFVKESDMI